MVEKNSLKNHTRSLASKWVGILRTFEPADNICAIFSFQNGLSSLEYKHNLGLNGPKAR